MGLDYYGMLGITRNASAYDINMAFRKKAVKFNPEREHGVKYYEIFIMICEAYEVLSNTFRKTIYDQYGEEGLKKGVITRAGFIAPWEYHRDYKKTLDDFFGTTSPYIDLLDQFNDFSAKKENKGLTLFKTSNINKSDSNFQDSQCLKKYSNDNNMIVHTVCITLEELYHGTMKIVTVPIKKIDPCSDQINMMDSNKIYTINIRPGLPEHTIFEFLQDSPRITIITKDEPHCMFWREGYDLHMKRTISLIESLTGLTFVIETLDKRLLHIAITNLITCNENNNIKIIKSEGMLKENGYDRGDLYTHLYIEYPKYLTQDKRKKIIEVLNKED